MPATFSMLQTATGFLISHDSFATTILMQSLERRVLAIGVSLDTPKGDPERRIAIINDQGREIGTVPVYSKPSLEHPASK
jgi:hypothetical protein